MTFEPSGGSSCYTVLVDNREVAPSLSPYGALGSTVARLCQVYEPLASRILLAPPKWMHAVAIYLWKTECKDLSVIARALNEKHPRQLIKECWSDAKPGLFPVLKRCGDRVFAMREYEQLNGLIGSSISDIVRHTKFLTSERIAFFDKALALDPLVTAACGLLNYNKLAAFNFDRMLQHMRELNLVGDHTFEAKALQSGAYKSIGMFVGSRLWKVQAPERLKVTPPLRQIATGEELSAIALRWKNCLRAQPYRIALATGAKVFIVMDEDGTGGRAVASFERTNLGWQMDECEAPGERRAPSEVRERIVDLLRADGIAAYTTTFALALAELESCTEGVWADE